MEKKLSVTLEEFKQTLMNDIKNSGLPIVIVDLVIKDLYNEIHELARDFTIKEMQEYRDSLSV